MLLTHVSCQLAILADAAPVPSCSTAVPGQERHPLAAGYQAAERSLLSGVRRLGLSRSRLAEAASQN